MFSGIVEATAAVIEKGDTYLCIERPSLFDDVIKGASIAVSGVCLSVVQFDEKSLQFDVVGETWDRSKLGSLKAGDRVNLERSLLADSRLDGHVVQGHVEGVGRVKMKEEKGKMVVAVPESLNTFLVQKGSIAIDGVSLTIASVNESEITIALVPHTLQETTLGSLQVGAPVNIETDVIGRYVYAFSKKEGVEAK